MAIIDLERDPEPEKEDWHNVSDPKTRRKLQNRQNQRARRQRNINRDAGPLVKQYIPGGKAGKFVYLPQSNEREQNNGVCDTSDQIQNLPLASSSDSCDIDDLVRRLAAEDDELMRSALNAMGSSLLTFGSMGGVNLRRYRANEYWQRGYYLHSDRLLSLLYYNVFRAFSWNAQILGLDLSQMAREDYPSPFLSTINSDASANTNLPKDLQPTEVQKEIYHHPGYDIFPCSIIRDNMIQHKMTSEEAEDEFCLDMEGLNRSSHGFGTDLAQYSDLDEGNRSGITIWGDPWKLESWEISEYIVLKYPWLVDGATEALMYTNARRRARGWNELRTA